MGVGEPCRTPAAVSGFELRRLELHRHLEGLADEAHVEREREDEPPSRPLALRRSSAPAAHVAKDVAQYVGGASSSRGARVTLANLM